MTSKRKCVFCNSENLTKEHVLPNWMSKLFKKGVTVTTTIKQKGKDDKVFKQQIMQHTAKIVCAGCNNGWMSKLESEAKPLLIKMVFDLNAKIKLSKKEQLVLTFWAQKTSFIIALAGGANYRIPEQSYQNMYKNNGPIEESSVRIGWRLPKKGKYGPHFTSFNLGEVTGPNKAEMMEKAGTFEVWRAILTVGNLVFHINGFTPNIFVEVGNVDKSVTPQIHPYEHDINWPLEWPVDALTSAGLTEYSEI